jgi:DNA-binding MarR family transcriptional regulator
MDEWVTTQVLKQDPIENQVLVALRRIIRSIDIHSRTLVKYYGLTGPQLIVLQEISKNDEITPGHLANAISLSQATVSGILERLEKRDLVSRRRSASDRRRVLVRTTAKADQMLESGPPIMQTSFIEAFQDLQDWEQTMILCSLQHLVNLMNAAALDAAPILATDATWSSTDESVSDASSDPLMGKDNGKYNR